MTTWLSALEHLGLCRPGETPSIVPLSGGVSSDIVRVDLRSGSICMKRALAKLRVDADWFAPLERNAAEARYLRYLTRIAPGAVPRLLAEDRESGLFVMECLAGLPIWKDQLRDGVIEVATAVAVAELVARIHGVSADDPDVPRDFANDVTFHAMRLEPYLLATANRYPECASALRELARVTGDTRRALVHGDVSPKNILVGPGGPVLLDAECAVFGDPAFDLAFCLNHLLLKCVWRPQHTQAYLACFDAFGSAYLRGVTWEDPAVLEARAARLLPGLLLARVDGKSPVEYLTGATQRDRVRTLAIPFLRAQPARLVDLRRSVIAD
jgi:aminoglycoside phosphotransferase (APT) family kinase protein